MTVSRQTALGDDGAGSNFKVGGADIIDGKGGVDTVSYNQHRNRWWL